MDFKTQIALERNNLIRDIKALASINSVEAEELPGKPFGNGPAEALCLFLKMAEDMGFQTENFDNYAGHADYDPVAGGASESVGILGHVDIVPAGDGWICDPFDPQVIDGKLYGRGVLDNKGPLLVCLYAMKILKDLNVPLRRKIRIIAGANEETDERCMHHYFGTLKIDPPTCSFTPDAAFPVKYAEMGVLQYEIITEISDDFDLVGGTVVNAVPEHAQMHIPAVYEQELCSHIPTFENLTGCTYKLTHENGRLLLEAFGRSCHAMDPEKGINAITGIMAAVDSLCLPGDPGRVAAFYMEKIGNAHHAEKLGAELHDDLSGSITFNVGKVHTEDHKLIFSVDNRVPVSYTCDDAIAAMKKALCGTGFHLENPDKTESIYTDPESDLVKTLIEVYREVTGDTEAQPTVDGGCTYARECPNCVAFGALLPGQPDTMHTRNEHVDLASLDTWMEIYLESLYRLAK